MTKREFVEAVCVGTLIGFTVGAFTLVLTLVTLP